MLDVMKLPTVLASETHIPFPLPPAANKSMPATPPRTTLSNNNVTSPNQTIITTKPSTTSTTTARSVPKQLPSSNSSSIPPPNSNTSVIQSQKSNSSIILPKTPKHNSTINPPPTPTLEKSDSIKTPIVPSLQPPNVTTTNTTTTTTAAPISPIPFNPPGLEALSATLENATTNQSSMPRSPSNQTDPLLKNQTDPLKPEDLQRSLNVTVPETPPAPNSSLPSQSTPISPKTPQPEKDLTNNQASDYNPQWEQLFQKIAEYWPAISGQRSIGNTPQRSMIVVTGHYSEANTTTVAPPPMLPNKKPNEFYIPILNVNQTDPVFATFKETVLQVLQPLHNEHKIQLQTDNENKLAKEIQQVYCELKKVERNQAVTLAQLSGLMAATAFGLGQCQRLTGSGQTLQLQQCRSVRVDVTAEETSCGWQPRLIWQQLKYTIGLDGFSLAKWSTNCQYSGPYVNLNNRVHTWKVNGTGGQWVPENATIHLSNLQLASKFDDYIVNDYKYELKGHVGHVMRASENMNMINAIIGNIQFPGSTILGDFAQSVNQTAHKLNFFSWNDKLKIVVFGLIGFLSLIALILICVKCIPFATINGRCRERLRRRNTKMDDESGIPMADLSTTAPLIVGAPLPTSPIPSTSYAPVPTEADIADAPPMYPSLREPHIHTSIIKMKDGPWLWNDGCVARPAE